MAVGRRQPVLWEPEDSVEAAQAARELIVERTRRGIGADGQAFEPLDDGSPTDLERSGRMLGTLEVVRTRRGAAVRATVDYARYVDARRPFMGLTNQQLEQLDQVVEQLLERRERSL